MKFKYYFFLVPLLLPIIANAQGLKFEAGKSERYTDAKDGKVGLTTVDTAQNVTWMRCLVDQEFDEAFKVCEGEGAKVTFLEATAFSRKVGNGWRLPTYWEVESAREYVMKILAQGKWESPSGFNEGGWACEKSGVWTSTGVKDEPNRVFAAVCKGFGTGNDIRGVSSERHGSKKDYMILVKATH